MARKGPMHGTLAHGPWVFWKRGRAAPALLKLFPLRSTQTCSRDSIEALQGDVRELAQEVHCMGELMQEMAHKLDCTMKPGVK